MICCFSGTGNSRYVAMQLGRLLGDEVLMLEGDALRRPPVCTGSRLIWVFPTYSWGVPPVVARLMRGVARGGDCRHFMVTTCGDDAGLVAAQWRRLLRGCRTATACSVTMPNTYTLMKGFDVDSPVVESAKLAAVPARIAAIAARIEGDEPGDDMHTGRFALFKSRVIYPWFVRFAMSPGPFAADADKCTRCGLCARSCPCGNIRTGADATPAWGTDCALCLRCYHICPAHAVRYGNATRSKGQYMFNVNKIKIK